jgi:carboxy-cis,cis-muconate cyclase
VEPAPVEEWKDVEEGKEYIALTDSEEGYVFVLSWDGEKVEEVARTKLEGGAGAATAVWLD